MKMKKKGRSFRGKDEEKPADEDKPADEEDEEEKKAKKYALIEEQLATLQQEHENLKSAYSTLENECKDLRDFKLNIENEKKDELINSFYMLSDTDKKDVIENKTKYSYDEIESKLCVICVRKGVTFNLNNEDNDAEKEHDDPITTFNLTEVESTVPAYISALRNTKNNRA